VSSEQNTKPLSPPQREAVEHFQGPVMVIAGAGCGKTTVLTQRIAHLLRSGICHPNEILAVTFTNNAAAEIGERVQRLLSDIDVSELKAKTFHAYCADVLAKAKQKFKIVEDNDLQIYLRKHIEELPLKIFTRAASPGQFIEQLMRFNGRCQDELVSAHDYRLFVEELKRRPLIQPPRVMKSKEMDAYSREDFIARCEEIAAVYTHVTKLLRDRGWGTFGDMLQQTVTLLKRSAPRLEEERQRCKYILIDEFQDSNFAQIELASLLGGDTANIFVVGDPDQAIYRFRGATSGAFEEFRQRYPQCKIVTLSDNYRSTPAILKCAHGLIALNPQPSFGREPLEAKGATRDVTAPVELLVSPTDVEAYAIVEQIEHTQAQTGGRWSDFAVLYKNNDHREAVLAELEARQIPVEVVGADLTDTTALRDLLSAARAVVRPDDSVALMRTAAFPQFEIDPAELKRAMASAEREQRNTPLVKTLKSVRGGSEVLKVLTQAQGEVKGLDAAQALERVRSRFDLADSPEAAELQKFVEKWLKKPTTDDLSLAGLIEYLDFYRDIPGSKIGAEDARNPNAVQLMTVHTAKGLEFRHVFVIKSNKGSFPQTYREDLFEFPAALSKTKYEERNPEETHEEEQRRLYYVAMTRAEESLTLSARPTKGGPYSGYCRELWDNRQLKASLNLREEKAGRARIEAGILPMVPIEEWIGLPAMRWSEQVKLSASAIESYNSCPLRFKLERDWSIPGETTAALQYGAAVHLALKGYYDAVMAGRKPTLDDLLASFADTMDSVAIEDAYQARLYHMQGRVHLTSFYDARAGEAPKVLSTERWFEITIGDVLVRGRMDRIDEAEGGVHIVDYKTGKPKDDKVAEKSLQLGIYALAAQQSGLKPVAMSFYNLEDNSLATTSPSKSDLVKIESQVQEVADKIRRGEFEAKKGFQCKQCAYRVICPAHEEKNLAAAKAVATVQ